MLYKIKNRILIIFLFTNVLFSQAQEKRNHAVQLLMETKENDEKVVELGNLIESSIIDKDKDAYMSFIDANAFRVNIENNNYSYEGMYNKEVFKGLLRGLNSLPKKIISEVEKGSYYDFVSYRYDEKRKFYSVLFRLFSEVTGLNYHDYRVSKLNGKFMFSDIYIYTTGENITETLSKFFLSTLSKQKKKKKLSKKGSFVEFMKIKRALDVANEGKIDEAFKLINSVKGKLAKERYYFLIKNQITSLVNDQEYKKSMEEMLLQFPDDTKLALNFIDYYILLEDYDKTLEAINNLQVQTEDDFLYYIKGNVEYLRKDYTEAIEHFKYITENYPDFFTAFTSLICAYSNKEMYTEAVTLLQELIEQDYTKEGLIEFVEEKDENGFNELENLVLSEEFKIWKEKE